MAGRSSSGNAALADDCGVFNLLTTLEFRHETEEKETMGPKKRKKGKRRCRVTFITPFSRAVTTYPTCVKANIAAKAMRTAMRAQPKSVRRGTLIIVEKE